MQPKTKQHVMIAVAILTTAGLFAAVAVATTTLQDKEALAAENTELKATVERQKPLSWGAYNFENQICKLHGHKDLKFTDATHSKNGTQYFSVLRCYLDSGTIVEYNIAYDPLADWNEIENKDQTTNDNLSIDDDVATDIPA